MIHFNKFIINIIVGLSAFVCLIFTNTIPDELVGLMVGLLILNGLEWGKI